MFGLDPAAIQSIELIGMLMVAGLAAGFLA